MGVSQFLWRILNSLSQIYITVHYVDSIIFSTPLGSYHFTVVHYGTCGNSSLKTPPIGFNKLSQHAQPCQAAAREQGTHNHQVEQEHGHNHAVHFLAAVTLLTTTPTNVLMWFHSVVFARVLIGGLYSEPSAVRDGVQWSWLWLFSVWI